MNKMQRPHCIWNQPINQPVSKFTFKRIISIAFLLFLIFLKVAVPFIRLIGFSFSQFTPDIQFRPICFLFFKAFVFKLHHQRSHVIDPSGELTVTDVEVKGVIFFGIKYKTPQRKRRRKGVVKQHFQNRRQITQIIINFPITLSIDDQSNRVDSSLFTHEWNIITPSDLSNKTGRVFSEIPPRRYTYFLIDWYYLLFIFKSIKRNGEYNPLVTTYKGTTITTCCSRSSFFHISIWIFSKVVQL